MKRLLTVLFALALVLAGCGAAADGPGDPAHTPTQPPVALDRAQHPMTRESGGAVEAYSLGTPAQGLCAMGDRLLVACVGVEGTTLRLLSGSRQIQTALVPELDGEVSLWASTKQALVTDRKGLALLDETLNVVERLTLPEHSSLAPDEGFSTVYYTQGDSLWAMDLDSGVFRLVRRDPGKTLEILSVRGSRVICRSYEDDIAQIEVLSASDGRALYTGSETLALDMAGSRFMAVRTDGPVTEYLYGTQESPQRFLGDASGFWKLLGGEKLLTQGKDTLYLYDMKAGVLRSQVKLKSLEDGQHFLYLRDDLWFLAEEGTLLCRWQTGMSGTQAVSCLGTWYTAQNPDQAGLDACQAACDQIGEALGVRVMLDVPEALAGHCRWEPEHQAGAIQAALEDIGAALEKFPKAVFEGIEKITESKTVTVCLVRGVRGPSGELLPDERGALLWVEGDPYILVEVGADSLELFYHQFWHLAETYLLTRNSILDTWETLNPEGFAYSLSYLETADAKQWLEGESRAFVDAFSTTFSREDRASVMVQAMLEDNRDLFQSDTMQAKLTMVCKSIRKAYKWNKEPSAFPWEQYLKEPLAYRGKK